MGPIKIEPTKALDEALTTQRKLAAALDTLRKVDDLWVYDVRPTLAAVVDSVRGDVAAGVTAARFQATIVAVTAAFCDTARTATGIDEVCLGGGVFQNRKVADDVMATLRSEGFTVHLGRRIPVNDGGVSFGQAREQAAGHGARHRGMDRGAR